MDKSIAGSVKLAGVGERVALVYVFTLLKADVTGGFDADPVALRVLCDRFGMAHGWTDEDMVAARGELVAAGLWEEIPGFDAVRVVGWSEHQKINPTKEAQSKYARPRTDTDIRDERSRIIRAWCAAWEDILKQVCPPLRPADTAVAREAAELQTCTQYDDDELPREFARQVKGLKGVSLPSTLKAAINNLGNDWKPRKGKETGDDEARVAGLRAETEDRLREMREIGKGKATRRKR